MNDGAEEPLLSTSAEERAPSPHSSVKIPNLLVNSAPVDVDKLLDTPLISPLKDDFVARNCRCHWAIASVVCGIFLGVMLICAGPAISIDQHFSGLDFWDVFLGLMGLIFIVYFFTTAGYVIQSLREASFRYHQYETEQKLEEQKAAIIKKLASTTLFQPTTTTQQQPTTNLPVTETLDV